MSRVTNLTNDTWVGIGDYDEHECCDCGLIHRISFKLEYGKILVNYRRLSGKTQKNRRRCGIVVTRKRG